TSCNSPNGIAEITSLEINGEERTSTSGYSIEWSLDRSFDEVLSTRDEIDDLAADTYYIRVSHSGTGCVSSIRSIKVEDELTIPVIALTTQDNTTCAEKGTGKATITSETAGLAIAWYEGDKETLIPNQNSSQLTGLSTGSYSAFVTHSTSGCTAKSNFTIGETLPQITLTTTSAANTNCVNENGMIALTSIAVNGQVAMDYDAFSIAWSRTEDFATIAFTEDTVRSLTPEDYYVRVTLDSISCVSSTAKVTVMNQLTDVAITLISSEIDKPGEEATGSLVINTVEDATIEWYSGEEAAGSVIGTTSTLSAINAGQYTVEVTDTTTGCRSSATYEVGADSRLEQTITFDLPEEIYQDELPLTLAAISNQNIPISYTITAGVGEIVGDQLISAGPGDITIKASNEGTDAVAATETGATIIIKGNYSLSGSVRGASGDQLVDGEVILYDQTQQEVRRVAFTAGSYTISEVREGSYFIRIEPSTEFESLAIKTYYEEVITIDDATSINLTSDMVIDVMLVTPGASPAGSGTISGTITLTNGRSKIIVGRLLDGTPLEGIGVYLVDRTNDAVVNRAITDGLGGFTFDNVASGQYRFVVDAIGFEIADLEADFDYDETQGQLEISAAIGQGGLEVEYAVVSSVEEFLKDIAIYPNPANQTLHIEDSKRLIRSVQLMNLTGQLTKTFQYSLDDQYNIGDLANGVYLLSIEIEDGQMVWSKVVIQH
ncbi:MAG: T9SS type A sorting domain-containing protein, partial [Bacteroidota bacterium]